jgi:hypothetical protein
VFHQGAAAADGLHTLLATPGKEEAAELATELRRRRQPRSLLLPNLRSRDDEGGGSALTRTHQICDGEESRGRREQRRARTEVGEVAAGSPRWEEAAGGGSGGERGRRRSARRIRSSDRRRDALLAVFGGSGSGSPAPACRARGGEGLRGRPCGLAEEKFAILTLVVVSLF